MMTVRCPTCKGRITLKQDVPAIPECEGLCARCGLQVVGFMEVREMMVRSVPDGDWTPAKNSIHVPISGQ